jgi:hypothetical protein
MNTNTEPEKEIDLPEAAETPPGYGNHHLYYDAKKKRWELHVTVDIGPKVVGKRICVRFPAVDAAIAAIKRDAVLSAFKALGLCIRPRMQKREKTSKENATAHPVRREGQPDTNQPL